MATAYSESGEFIDVSPLGDAMDRSRIAALKLVKTPSLEVVRLIVPAGKDVGNHTAPGDITVQCLEGAVDFTTGNRAHRLVPGRLLYLTAGSLHALRGVEDSSVLVTIVRCDPGGSDAG